MSVGAKASDSVHNLLVKEGVVEGSKVNVLPKKSPIAKEVEEAEAAAPVAEEAPSEEGGEETPVEETSATEEVVEETPAEETAPVEEAPAAEEAPAEEAPAEEEKKEEA